MTKDELKDMPSQRDERMADYESTASFFPSWKEKNPVDPFAVHRIQSS